MTTSKAKLFKTAQIAKDACELPEGFSAGEFVAVRFAGKGSFGINFQVSHSEKFPVNDTVVMSENDLEHFVL